MCDQPTDQLEIRRTMLMRRTLMRPSQLERSHSTPDSGRCADRSAGLLTSGTWKASSGVNVEVLDCSSFAPSVAESVIDSATRRLAKFESEEQDLIPSEQAQPSRLGAFSLLFHQLGNLLSLVLIGTIRLLRKFGQANAKPEPSASSSRVTQDSDGSVNQTRSLRVLSKLEWCKRASRLGPDKGTDATNNRLLNGASQQTHFRYRGDTLRRGRSPDRIVKIRGKVEVPIDCDLAEGLVRSRELRIKQQADSIRPSHFGEHLFRRLERRYSFRIATWASLIGIKIESIPHRDEAFPEVKQRFTSHLNTTARLDFSCAEPFGLDSHGTKTWANELLQGDRQIVARLRRPGLKKWSSRAKRCLRQKFCTAISIGHTISIGHDCHQKAGVVLLS